jgi:hypothetical protein
VHLRFVFAFLANAATAGFSDQFRGFTVVIAIFLIIITWTIRAQSRGAAVALHIFQAILFFGFAKSGSAGIAAT